MIRMALKFSVLSAHKVKGLELVSVDFEGMLDIFNKLTLE